MISDLFKTVLGRLASEQDSRPCRNRWLADFVGLACCDAAAGASHSSRAAHDGSRRRVRAAVFVRAARLEVSAIPKQPDVGPACDRRRGKWHDAREGAHED